MERQTGANCDSEWIHTTVQRTQRHVPARLVARDNNRHTLIRNAVTKPEALLTLRAECEPIKPRRRNVRSREDPCPCTRVERVGEDALRACDVRRGRVSGHAHNQTQEQQQQEQEEQEEQEEEQGPLAAAFALRLKLVGTKSASMPCVCSVVCI